MAKKKQPAKPEEIKSDQEPQELPSAYTMFSRKKDRGFVAMTQEASMRADETKPKTKELPPKIKSCIHKIRED